MSVDSWQYVSVPIFPKPHETLILRILMVTHNHVSIYPVRGFWKIRYDT